MKLKTNLFLALAVMLAACSHEGKSPQRESALMQNEDRITQIISQMSLEEKVAMLHGKNMFSSAGVPSQEIADMEYADGPFGIREEMEPHSWMPLGLTTDSATFFPTGSALAATWSPELAYAYGAAMAKEARLRGKDMILGPAINIQRVPLGGRTYEYLSEDPLLSADLAVGYTKGSQDNGVAVCLKHFALNNQENDRGSVDVRVSERAMHEIYLVPFEAAVKEGDAYALMSAYNKVNGKWCSENPTLLDDILRGEWGFKGMVISDWGGVHSTEAITAGNNVEMPGDRYLGQALIDAVKAGEIDESVIDQRVREILRVRLAIEPVAAGLANTQMTSQPEQQKVAYDVASKSIVLLKNEDGVLPINTDSVKKILVVGDNAVATMALGGVGAGVKALYEVTPLAGLQDRLSGKDVELQWVQGYKGYDRVDRYKGKPYVSDADPKLLAEAVKAARGADLVIFVGGDNREVETEGSDRPNMVLPSGQDQVLKALQEVNPQIVTVIVAGAPVELGMAQQVSKAMLMSWFNGSEGGNALADVLLGEVSPSGRLPFTLPVTLGDSPAIAMGLYTQAAEKGDDIFVNLVDNKDGGEKANPIADYTDDIYVGYRYYDTKGVAPLYPFGYGLTYGDFEYTDIDAVKDGDEIVVNFTLTNKGAREAEEVAQVYVSRPGSKVERPAKELKAFKRVSLKPGESRNVEMRIPIERLRHYGEQGWAVEPGRVDVHVGANVSDIRVEFRGLSI